jgi:ADP-heptose:LPS heptosyltransferase
MHSHTRVPDARKIAAVRANRIGDLVFALPALAALRNSYPDAEIVLLGGPWHAEFFGSRASPVDRAVVMPPVPGVGLEPGTPHDATRIPPFVARMREQHFDIALQMHGGGRYSNAFVRRLGARLTAGARSPDAEPLDRTLPYPSWQAEYFRLLEIAALVGADAAEVTPRLQATRRDLAESLAAVPRSAEPLAVVHPGATDPRRRWPAKRFAAVADALAERGCVVCVTGAGAEASLVNVVCARMRHTSVPLGDALSLGGLVGLLARAAVVVGNDTGPLHLAVALGTPSVGVYWFGNLYTCAPPTRARHRPLVAWQLTCPRCGADIIGAGCEHQGSLVESVSIEEVRDAALGLLAESQAEAPSTAWSSAAGGVGTA